MERWKHILNLTAVSSSPTVQLYYLQVEVQAKIKNILSPRRKVAYKCSFLYTRSSPTNVLEATTLAAGASVRAPCVRGEALPRRTRHLPRDAS